MDVWSQHQGLAHCTKLQLLIISGALSFLFCHLFAMNGEGTTTDIEMQGEDGYLTSLNRYLLAGQIDRLHVVCLSESQSPSISCWQQGLSLFLNTGKCNECCGSGVPKPLFLFQWKLDAYWGGWNWVSGVENLMVNGFVMKIFTHPYASVMEGLVCKISQYPLYIWNAR